MNFRKERSLLLSVMLIALLAISGCGFGRGKKLEYNGGELYYTSSVTKAEAERLGRYLAKGFFDGNRKTVQLTKTGNTYEFRMVVKKGIETDPEYIEAAKAFAGEMSEEVFNGSPVDIHLCDDRLKTLRVVVEL